LRVAKEEQRRGQQALRKKLVRINLYGVKFQKLQSSSAPL
jgi:hypothetical protein